MQSSGLRFAVQGGFFLEDQRSKFGTLVELKRPLKLERWISGVSFQVNKHFMVPLLCMLLVFCFTWACVCLRVIRGMLSGCAERLGAFSLCFFAFSFPFSQHLSSVCIPVH